MSGTSAALQPLADAVKPVRHPEAPAPGELLGAHYEHCFDCGGGQRHGLHLQARAKGGAREICSRASGRIGGPGGPVAVRAETLFIEVKGDHAIENGRPAWIRAAMAGPDRVRRARAFEVTP